MSGGTEVQEEKLKCEERNSKVREGTKVREKKLECGERNLSVRRKTQW